ncbi:hypothetical protein BYT27DRAFT_7215995 [Phlegmacium glaucopus]|nr:hypothetical protein BYT27DRAFT_7215995 [Phlegmacium glaucopus]
MLVPNTPFLPIVLPVVSAIFPIVLCLGTGTSSVSDAVTIPGVSFPSHLTWPNPRFSISDALPLPSDSAERKMGTNNLEFSDAMCMPSDSVETSIGTNDLELSDVMHMLSDSLEMNIGTNDLEFSDVICMLLDSVEMSIGTNGLEFLDAMCMPLDSVGINSHVDQEFLDVILTSLSIRTYGMLSIHFSISKMHLGGLFESCFDQ